MFCIFRYKYHYFLKECFWKCFYSPIFRTRNIFINEADLRLSDTATLVVRLSSRASVTSRHRNKVVSFFQVSALESDFLPLFRKSEKWLAPGRTNRCQVLTLMFLLMSPLGIQIYLVRWSFNWASILFCKVLTLFKIPKCVWVKWRRSRKNEKRECIFLPVKSQKWKAKTRCGWILVLELCMYLSNFPG